MVESVAAVTVSCVPPARPANDALIVEMPGATPVARPGVLGLIVAMGGSDDAHAASAVTLPVDVSEYVMVATNCCVVPAAMDGVAGVTAKATRETQAPVFVLQWGAVGPH